MASIRILKKDIDYLVEEVLSDCLMTIYFQPDKKDEAMKILEDTVEMRNDLFRKVNNPVEKNNKSLIKKHYAQIRREMFAGIDDKFNRLSAACKNKQ